MIDLQNRFAFIFIGMIVFPIAVLLTTRKREKVSADIISYDSTIALRGVAALIIAIGHFSNHVINPGIMKLYSPVTGYSVSLFLFLSGYSLEKQFISNKNYLTGFIKTRITRIYVPWIVAVCILAVLHRVDDFHKIIQSLLMFKTIYAMDKFNWYVLAILYFYLVFYLVSKMISDRGIKRICFISFSVAWFVFCVLRNKGVEWYNNSMLFPFGIYIADNEEKYAECLNALSGIKRTAGAAFLLIVSAILYIVAQLTKTHVVISNIIWNFGGISFVLFILFALTLIEIRSRVLMRAGNASYEIFLMSTGIVLWYYSIFEATWWSPVTMFALWIVIVCIDVMITRFLVKRVKKMMQ